jgi:HTH-type transcriptional regulator/antitoxin HigA
MTLIDGKRNCEATMATMTRPTRNGYEISRSFQDLLIRYPLLPIENEQDYDRASEVLQSLFGRKNLDADQKKYLDSLTILVEKYEAEHDAPELDKNVSPVELLRHLMDANDMTVSELGKIVGTQALASMILSRKRRISLNNAKRLAKHFRLGVEAFV